MEDFSVRILIHRMQQALERADVGAGLLVGVVDGRFFFPNVQVKEERPLRDEEIVVGQRAIR